MSTWILLIMSLSEIYLDSLSSNLYSKCQSPDSRPHGGVKKGSHRHTSGPQWSPPKTTTLKEDIVLLIMEIGIRDSIGVQESFRLIKTAGG
jgi:hypothetical protein